MAARSPLAAGPVLYGGYDFPIPIRMIFTQNVVEYFGGECEQADAISPRLFGYRRSPGKG